MISLEIRQKIVEARDRGLTGPEIQKAYGYGRTAIYRLIGKYRRGESIVPAVHTRGRKTKISKDDLAKIEETIQAQADITLKEVIEQLALPISVSGLCRIVRKKLGYTYKKRWCMRQKENGQMCK